VATIIPAIKEAQKIVKKAGFDPGPIDGIPGKKTENGLRAFINVKVPDDEIKVLDVYRDYFHGGPDSGAETPDTVTGTIIDLKPIKLTHYSHKKVTFWLSIDVMDSFKDAIDAWIAKGNTFRCTETLRTLAVQINLKKRKPSLAVVEGCTTVAQRNAKMLEFYKHMAKYGWYNIYSKPGDVQLCKGKWNGREAWHIQKIDPVGVHKNTYLRTWAKTRGGEAALMKLKYNKIK
jgi:hypothetical protein